VFATLHGENRFRQPRCVALSVGSLMRPTQLLRY
jgi:hypothetical protein